jgi:CRISPR-associated protein Csy2
MVSIMHFRELLEIEDVQTRTEALRRAFFPFIESIDVTGEEFFTLVTLLNLTYRKNQVSDLLDLKLAKETIKNKTHLDKCIEEVAWMHTHNLKYPDPRVSRQNLVVDSPIIHSNILSSANCTRSLGWSHDGAKVNLSKLFGCHFIWQGRVTCLAYILCEMPDKWKEAFKKLGMLVKQFEEICVRLNQLVCKQSIPNHVDRFSIQVLFPNHDSYLAITPVVSHALQGELQRSAINRQGNFTRLQFNYPSSVSGLVASVGGNVYVLNYPPDISSKKYEVSDSAFDRLKEGLSLLQNQVLVSKQFAEILDGILNIGVELALKQRKQKRLMCLKQLRSFLCEWIMQLTEYRYEIQNDPIAASSIESEKLCSSSLMEYQFLTFPNNELKKLIQPLFTRLNTEMSKSDRTSKYAFHQKLMPTLFETLKSIINKLASDQKFEPSKHEDLSSTRYLHLKKIKVFDAQALSSPYCSGVPSLTAVWGMMHNYQRQLNESLGTNIRMTSFSWFIQEFSLVKGKKLPEFGMFGNKGNDFKRSGIIDSRYCDLVFDLVIHINGYEHELESIEQHHDVVVANFPSKFAGGVMHPPVSTEPSYWCSFFKSEAALFSKLKNLPFSGKWIMPTRLTIDSVSHLLFLLNSNRALNPTLMGYLPLTKPVKRAGSLTRLHSYAEPVIGVVECTSAIEIKLQGKENFFRRAFWMLDAKEHSILIKRI